MKLVPRVNAKHLKMYLFATIGQQNVITTGGLVTIASFHMSEIVAWLVVLYVVFEVVTGWFVVFVASVVATISAITAAVTLASRWSPVCTLGLAKWATGRGTDIRWWGLLIVVAGLLLGWSVTVAGRNVRVTGWCTVLAGRFLERAKTWWCSELARRLLLLLRRQVIAYWWLSRYHHDGG